MSCKKDTVSIELCKKNPCNNSLRKIIFSYPTPEAEYMFQTAIADYIRINADPGYLESSIGNPLSSDSIGILTYDGKVLTVNIPINPTEQVTANLDAVNATPVSLDQVQVPDGTATLTITVTSRDPPLLTVLFDNATGDDYLFDSSTLQITVSP